MVDTRKPQVDSSWEQEMSETSTLPDLNQDVYERVPSKIRGAPTNYLRISKRGVAIEGQYFIDLSIPPADIVSGETNLSLHTTSGAVTADVWLTGNNKSKRVSMKLCTDNGRICAKIHDVFSDDETEPRPSFDIDLRANYGDVSLSLPRSFRGPITIHSSSHERVAFSSALEERTAPLSDVQNVRVYFVGNRPRSGPWRGDNSDEEEGTCGSPEEPLDELSVGGWHTGVRIRWDDEPELPQTNPNGWEHFCMGTVRFFTSGRVA